MQKAIIVVGLGFGDEGKGSVVDYLVREHKASLVVRYNGGHQAAHTVVLPDGRQHTFSQFGAGTLAGANTYIGPNVIIEPKAMSNERNHLQRLGVSTNLLQPVVHPRALVTAPYHAIWNRIQEDMRSKKHGSCGVGIGETRKYWLDHGQDAIFASDFAYSMTTRQSMDIVEGKLELMQQRFLAQLFENNEYSGQLRQQLYDLTPYKAADHMVSNAIFKVEDFASYAQHAVTIFEGAQGVLLDENHGFHPYTTWSTTTTKHALDMLGDECDEIETLGVIRSYYTRHGAGPLPTEVKTFGLVDKNNPDGKYQGPMRFGHFDLVLFRYALSIQNVDGIFLTHTDNDISLNVTCYQIGERKPTTYLDINDINLYETICRNRRSQEKLATMLNLPSPFLHMVLENGSLIDEINKYKTVLYESHGPTHEDKRRLNVTGIDVQTATM